MKYPEFLEQIDSAETLEDCITAVESLSYDDIHGFRDPATRKKENLLFYYLKRRKEPAEGNNNDSGNNHNLVRTSSATSKSFNKQKNEMRCSAIIDVCCNRDEEGKFVFDDTMLINEKDGHSNGASALHLAILHGYEGIASTLLQEPRFELTNDVDLDQSTVLHYACMYGCENIVRELLKK